MLRLWIALGTGILATLLWDTGLLLPVKLLIVLVHEIWHGLAALASGAFVGQLNVRFDEAGETVVTGLFSKPGFLLTVSAGYPGTALTGALLLHQGLAGRSERVTLFGFSAVLLYMSYLFTESGSPAFWTGMGWAIGLALLGLMGRLSARITLLVFGTLFLWYCVYDLLDFARDVNRTDAGILARWLIEQDWPVARGMAVESLALAISSLWSFLTLAILAAVLGKALIYGPAQEPAAAPPPPEPPPGPPPFPGSMTPEVQEWLLANGFGLDGRPLPPELLEEPPSQGAQVGVAGGKTDRSGAGAGADAGGASVHSPGTRA